MSDRQTITVSDSEEEADLNLPSRDECEARCQTFAEVTGTDTALAMFYLQDREWSVDLALDAFFAENNGGSGKKSADAPGARAQSRTITSAASSGSSAALRESKQESAPYLTLQPPIMQQKNEKRIRVLSWNVDGLDPDNLQSRTEGMISVLLQEAPEIIFLQEVIDRSLQIIQSKCDSYQVFPGVEEQLLIPGAYFTAMLLRKDCLKVNQINIDKFPTTCMERTLMEVTCEVKGMGLTLMTSHLESTAEHSAERKKQLGFCFDRMLKASKYDTVIFGGDLNLRDKELKGLTAIPAKVYDMWECTGKRPEAKYTWDLNINDNKQFGTKFQPRCRFDRLYIRHASLAKLKPVYFELVGIQRLASCRRFPSDHWGILAHLDILA